MSEIIGTFDEVALEYYCNSDKVGPIILDAISLSIYPCLLCLLCIIGWVAIRKIHKQQRMTMSMKCPLYSAMLLTFLGLCIGFAMGLICMGPMPRFDGTHFTMSFIWLIGAFAYQFFFISLILNFFLRLDVTFAESVLAMSTMKRRMFLTFIFLELFLTIAAVVLLVAFIATDIIILEYAFSVLFILFWVIYVLISFALVREFNRNLLEMAEFCAPTSVSPKTWVLKLNLSESQKRNVNLSAKYLALYFISAASSVFFASLVFVIPYSPFMIPPQVQLALAPIDAFVNLCCLILSYASMSSAYEKYCKRMDGCFKDLTSRLMKKRVRQIMRERIVMNPQQTKLHTLSSVSSALCEDGSTNI